MLAADTASMTAKPSMTLARNRRDGSLSDIDCDNPTSNPRLLSENQRTGKRELSNPRPKIRAEWIRGGKFGANLQPGTDLVARSGPPRRPEPQGPRAAPRP